VPQPTPLQRAPINNNNNNNIEMEEGNSDLKSEIVGGGHLM
jgi:hypothetical protein